ncbi:MAG: site-specific integrase [Phycisphaerales bacterium]
MPAGFKPVRVPSYRRHKPSGQAVVTLSGRDVYLGPWKSAESKRRFKQLVAEWLAAGGQVRPDASEGTLSVVELAAAYWKHLEHTYTPTTLPSFKRAVGALRRLYGDLEVVAFGPVQLKTVRDQLVREGLARTTVNRHVHQVRACFRWGVEEGMVPGGVYHALTAIRGLRRGRTDARETEPVRPVADAMVETTVPHLTPVVADMVRLQRLTGMRPGEVCVMTTGAIETTGRVWLYRPPVHKTAHLGHERVIPLGPKSQTIVGRYLRPELDAPLFSPAESERLRRESTHARRRTLPSCGNVPGSNRKHRPRKSPGDRWTTQSYGNAIEAACRWAFPLPAELDRLKGETKAGWRTRLTPEELEAIRRWRRDHSWAPNQLRHARATEVRAAFGLDGAAATLGHAQLETTAEWYAERSRELAERVALATG